MQLSTSAAKHYQTFSAANRNALPIRTLYVAPVKPFISHLLKEYFEQFGEVLNVRVHSRDSFHFGFIEYKTVESAAAALSEGIHRIGYSTMKVKPADPWHQTVLLSEPPNPLLVAPEQDSPSHILNALNIDCLREIFRYFDPTNLCSVADVCVLFKDVAKAAFAEKYKKLDISETCTKHVESLFRNFSQTIRMLKMANTTSPGKVLNIIHQYETPELRELELNDFVIKGKLVENLRSTFANLEKLSLVTCQFNNSMHTLTSVCVNLKTLSIENCETGKGKGIKHVFPKLEEAHFITNDEFDYSAVNTFIAMNPTITKLSIIQNEASINMPSAVLESIGKHLPNLLHLIIEQEGVRIDHHIKHLGHLKKLKTLVVDFDTKISVESLANVLLTNDVPIEQLKIANGKITDKAIRNITKLKQMKILGLECFDKLTDDHLVELAKELPQLEELHLANSYSNRITTIGLKKMLPHAKKLSQLYLKSIESFTIDANDYYAILKIVQNRPEKTKLSIHLEGDGEMVNVREETLAENMDIFYIDEIIKEFPLFTFFDLMMHWHGYDDDDYDDDGLTYGMKYGYDYPPSDDDNLYYYDKEDGRFYQF